jgi:Carboxypeptidase regulatory-like domain
VVWKILSFAILVAGLALATNPARAQIATGSMSGTVIDPTGAAVPDATVRVHSNATGFETSSQTDNAGNFKLALLPVGPVDVQISKSGFRTAKYSNVEVLVNADYGFGEIRLEVGESTSTIEVTAAPPIIESTTSQITNTWTDQAIQTFAGVAEFQGLDNLALQLPGVVNTRDLTFGNANGPGFSVNGLRGENNDQQVDGQNNNDNSIGGPALFVENVDWVSEYQITTNNFSAEYGRNAGSVVNEITKSGTNTWHGTVSDVETNSVLQTLTNQQKFFEGLTKVPRSNFNAPSTTIGGPLWKNHVFVFGGFDVQDTSSVSNYATGALTPTPTGLTELAACFPGSTAITALENIGPFGVKGGNPQVLPGSTVTADEGGCTTELGGVERILPTSVHEYDWTYKMDLVISNSDRLFGRYIYEKSNFLNTDIFATAAAGYPSDIPALAQLMLLDWNHTFSGRAVNDLRVSYGRENTQFGGNSIGNTIPVSTQLANALTEVVFENPALLGFGVPSGAPQGRIVSTYQVQDNFAFTIGRHQLKMGYNGTAQRSPNIFLPNFNGVYVYSDFGGGPTDPTGMGANASDFTVLTDGTPNYPFKEYDHFVYFQDDWKIKDNLTLNLGLTYSYYGQPFNLYHSLTEKQQNGPNPFWSTALPQSITTLPTIPSDKTLFGPNAGFAYTPRFWEGLLGRDKTVIRGGYRLAYDPVFYNIYILFPEFAPLSLEGFIPGAPLPAEPTGPTIRALLSSSLPFGGDPRSVPQVAVSPNFSPDKVHSWSLGIQRELSKSAAFEIRYVGNHGTDLFQSINENPFIAGLAASFPNLVPAGDVPCPSGNVPPAGALSPATGRVNCNQGIVAQFGNTGYSDYEALQAEFRTSNLFNQLTLLTSYTFSKTTDNASAAFQSTAAAGSTLAFSQDPLNFEGAEHGLSGLDFPQSWTVQFVEDIPAFRHQHGFLGHVFGGWAVSGNYAITSGQPYTPFQKFLNTVSGGVANDVAFNENILNQADTSRPFYGSKSAPADSVGVYAADACAYAAAVNPGWAAACGATPTQLISVNALNASGAATPVTNNQVRYIANGATADSIFGTPFGNVPRNAGRDFHTNIGNFSLFKNIKFTERDWLQWHMTMTNVFNHPNFATVDPDIEDAGLLLEGTGFGTPYLTSGGFRTILFGLKVVF